MRVSGVTKYPLVDPSTLLFSPSDAGDHIDAVQRRWSRWRPPSRARGLRRHWCPGRLGRRFGCDRRAARGRFRDPRRDLRRLSPLRDDELMLGTLFSTPRSEPDHLLPAAGGTIVLALLLPVIPLLGWSIAGWGLAALLWLGLHGLDLLVVRARSKPAGTASSGIQAFALFF